MRLATDAVHASVALFRLERLNALTTDLIDPDFSVNSGEQRVQGVELEGKWQLSAAVSLHAGYAWMDGEVTASNDGDVGARLGDLARHQFNLSSSLQLDEQWSAYVRGNYSSARPLLTGSRWVFDGYNLVGAGLRYQASQWSAQLALNNLFDEGYYSASGTGFVVYPGEPRQASLQLAWQW